MYDKVSMDKSLIPFLGVCLLNYMLLADSSTLFYPKYIHILAWDDNTYTYNIYKGYIYMTHDATSLEMVTSCIWTHP